MSSLYIFKRTFCYLILFSIPLLSNAQNAQSGDTTFIDKVTKWLEIYEFSNPSFAEKERQSFKKSTFCNTYTLGLVSDSTWISKKLNTISGFRNTEKQEPYISFAFHLSEENGSFSINPDIITSFEYNSDLNAVFRKEIKTSFSSVGESYFDIVAGMLACYAQLEEDLGSSLAPSLFIKIHESDDVFLNGEEIKIFDGLSNELYLEVLNNSGEILKAPEVIWQNANPFENGAIVTLNENQSSKIITAKTDEHTISVNVLMQSSTNNLNEILRELLIDILKREKTKALKKIQELKTDSIDYYNAVLEVKEILNKENVQLASNSQFNSSGIYSLYSKPVKISPEEEAKLYEILPLKKGAETIEQYLKAHDQIRIAFNRAAFADLMINNPENIKNLLNDLKVSSGQLLARLLLGKDRHGTKEKARNIIVQFLNAKIQSYSYEG